MTGLLHWYGYHHETFVEIIQCSAKDALATHRQHPHINPETLMTFFMSAHMLEMYQKNVISFEYYVQMCANLDLLDETTFEKYAGLNYTDWPAVFSQEDKKRSYAYCCY